MGGPKDESELVLDAAAALIVTRGFSALTLGEVSAAARVPAADLEASFLRKDTLLTAIVDRAASLITNSFDVTPSAAPGTRLEELLTRQLRLVDDHRPVFLVSILRLLRPSEYPIIVPSLTPGLSRLEHYFIKFDDWLEANAITRSDSTRISGHVAGGAVAGTLVRWATAGGVERVSDEAPALVAMLLR